MPRWLSGPLLATLLAVALVPAGAAASGSTDDPAFVGVLDFSEDGTSELFWHGGEVGEDLAHTWPFGVLGLADCDDHPCFAFELEVAEAGAELRIGIDVPERINEFEYDVTGPDGVTRSASNPNRYNSEIRVDDPVPGTWTIEVRPYNAVDTPFGMRAGLLEAHHERTPDDDGLLLPNLRMTPPFEFGFVAPANPANGIWPPDEVNPPLSVAGIEPLSCAADETVEDGALRCLRFSFGLENAGEGNFDIRYRRDNTDLDGPAWQCVEQADGPPIRRDAGSWSFHVTHGHDHYYDIVEHELFHVVDPETGAMEAVGGGEKLGYSPADQHFADWDRFVQALPGTSGSAGNCAPDTNRRLGLSAGWGDVYRWQRPGNYIEFSDNPDGHYVVRLTADPLDHVLETTTDDNVAYAYITVTGDDVEVLEQGRGLDPWDPDKLILPSRFGPDIPSSRPQG